MFGRKQELIVALQGDLARVQERRDTYYRYWTDAAEKLSSTDSELKIVQEAYSSRMTELDESKAEIGRLDERIHALEYDLAEACLQSETLREEAAESSRMLELYKALVASLRIVIKLPAKKPRG